MAGLLLELHPLKWMDSKPSGWQNEKQTRTSASTC